MEAKSHPVHKAKSLHRPQSVSGKESEVLTFAPLPEKHLVRTEWEHSDSLLHMQSLVSGKCQIYVKQCQVMSSNANLTTQNQVQSCRPSASRAQPGALRE